jgi:hypothetical protein
MGCKLSMIIFNAESLYQPNRLQEQLHGSKLLIFDELKKPAYCPTHLILEPDGGKQLQADSSV